MQFEFLRKKAENGDSFVVVGRCSETVLKKYDCLTSIFVLGDYDKKLQRTMDVYALSEKDAKAKMSRHDRKRKAYHNRHSEGKWGDSRLYDLCMNSSTLGMDTGRSNIERLLYHLSVGSARKNASCGGINLHHLAGIRRIAHAVVHAQALLHVGDAVQIGSPALLPTCPFVFDILLHQ